MRACQINQVIPLTFRKLLNGQPITGLTVSVVVYEVNTNAILLASTLLVETSGVYNYNWAGVSEFKNCRATYSDGENEWDEYFTVSDIDDQIERSSSHAV